MSILKLGLVIAKPQFSELEKFVSEGNADAFLFPEGFLHSDNLEKALRIARKYKKWIFTGMDDYREQDKKFQTGIAINPAGVIVGEHKKTSLAKAETEKGYSRGDKIEAIETEFGKIGFSICFEIDFPEVARILALKGAKLILNPIGTGMWHEAQYKHWASKGCARANENGVYVDGCSHFTDAIPIAYAYDQWGNCLINSREVNRMIPVTIDTGFEPRDLGQRRPELYDEMIKA